MSEKKVIIYLNTGQTKEHLLLVEDDNHYKKQINKCISVLNDQKTILHFTTPLCFYKVQNIIAIEFSDPPPEINKLPIGYKRVTEPNP